MEMNGRTCTAELISKYSNGRVQEYSNGCVQEYQWANTKGIPMGMYRNVNGCVQEYNGHVPLVPF